MTAPLSNPLPNIVMVVLDDLGFADLGCFGSSIATPTIDALAGTGLTYTNFHVTPLCSPTRASLLTGRNHHAVGMGMLSDAPQDAPGYTGRIPRSAATVARHLRDHGYGTFAVGKWHLAPRDESAESGPFTHWPLQMGFERYYGFLRGLTDQWFPNLVRDNSFVDQPYGPAEGYHLTDDLVTQSIEMMTTHRAGRGADPFFLYFAPGAMHSPHQAPREHIERYRGAFDHGWDVERALRHERQLELGVVPPGTINTPRPPSVPAWDELDDDARAVYARQMEVYAGFLSHTDEQIGRLIEHLRLSEELDDTVVLITSDNGPAHHPSRAGTWSKFEKNDVATMKAHLDEFGSVGTHNHYARGWTWAGSTPFQYWKSYSWLGGVRTPLVAHWPAARAGGSGIRRQFVHAIDVMPTLLEVAGVASSAEVDGVVQQPIDGRSMLTTVSTADAPSPRDTQYFEMLGSRAIYHDRWKATTDHLPYPEMWEPPMEGSVDFDRDRWSLFDLESDFSEAVDLAAEEPERLKRMVALWESEAERNHVLPMYDTPDRPTSRPVSSGAERRRWIHFAGEHPVHTPDILAGSFDLTVEVRVDAEDSGVVLAHHPQPYTFSVRPVWALHLEHGVVVLTWGLREQQLRVPTVLAAGDHIVGVRHRLLDEATARVEVLFDAAVVGDLVVSSAGVPPVHDLWIGRGVGLAWDGYDPRAALRGSIRRVVLEVEAAEAPP
jgi:arylsulfatase A-like enzyme